MSKRIALIHATPVAMHPVVEAFRHGWTDADTFSVLDDALGTDLARAGVLNAALKRRIAALAEYVTGIGVDAILYTCSAFGEAIDAVARATPMPVLKPNEAMFAGPAPWHTHWLTGHLPAEYSITGTRIR